MEIRNLYTERTIDELLYKISNIDTKHMLFQVKPNKTYCIGTGRNNKVIVKMYNENMQYIGCYINEGSIVKSPNDEKVRYLAVEYNCSTFLNREQRRHIS